MRHRGFFPALGAGLIALAWWMTSASEPKKIGQFGEQLSRASASADGKLVAGLRQQGPEQWNLTVWDTATGKPAWPAQPVGHPPATSRPLAWSEDGRWLAVGGRDEVVVLEAASGKRRRLSASWLVREVRISGDWLMARCDGLLFLWDLKSGRLVRRLEQPSLLAADLNFERKWVATQSLDEAVRLYQMPEGRLLGQLPGGGACTQLRFVRDGQWLVGGFRFRSQRNHDCVRVHDCLQRKQLQQFSEPDMVGFDVCRDGSRVVSRSPQSMTLWNAESGQPIVRQQRPGLLCEALSPEGKSLLSLAENGRDVCWLVSDSGKQKALLEQAAPPQAFGYFGPGGGEILSGSCALWRLRD